VSGQHHAPAALPLAEAAPDTRRIGGWVGPRPELDVTGKRKTGKNVPPPSSEAKSMQSKWQERAACRPLKCWLLAWLIRPCGWRWAVYRLVFAGYVHGLLFESEDAGSEFFRNVGELPRGCWALYPRNSIRQTSQIHQTWRHISTDSIFGSHNCEIKYNVLVFASSGRSVPTGWTSQLEWYLSLVQRGLQYS
jgi:hypothetical protein